MTTIHPATLAVHAGNEVDPATGAVAPPIHLSTTVRHGPAGERSGAPIGVELPPASTLPSG